jgi:hypothetical protein
MIGSISSADNARTLSERKTESGLDVVFLENKLTGESLNLLLRYISLRCLKHTKRHKEVSLQAFHVFTLNNK